MNEQETDEALDNLMREKLEQHTFSMKDAYWTAARKLIDDDRRRRRKWG